MAEFISDGLTFTHDPITGWRSEWTVFHRVEVGHIFLGAKVGEEGVVVPRFAWQSYSPNGTEHGEATTFEAAREAVCRAAIKNRGLAGEGSGG